MSFFTREQCLQRLRDQVTAGKPIIGGGAGTGLSAKCAEAGGIDLIIIYNSGRFRMAGRGSLSGMMPYGDANQIVMDMAREVLPVAHQTPVMADVLVLCHGGPISEPEDAQYILQHTEGVVGFFGASSIERLPTEVAITNCVRRFKGLSGRA